MFTTDLFLKFFRFIFVGITGAVMDFSFTYLIKEKAKIHKLIANAFGFTMGASTTFIFNRLYTFHSNNPEILTQYIKFIVVSSFGLAINTLIIYLLTEKRQWNFWFSKISAAGIVLFWNFTANYYYTFKL